MELVLKTSTNLPCSMSEKMLMKLREVDLGLRPALIFTIIQLIMVDDLIFIVMVITGVVIGITPDNFLHRTMAN